MLLQIADFCSESKEIWKLVGTIYKILLIIIPAVIVLLGAFDLGKAVMAGEDKEIKEAQKMFIKRVVYGVIIFFIPIIIQTVYSLFTINGEAQEPSSTCWTCVIKRGKC